MNPYPEQSSQLQIPDSVRSWIHSGGKHKDIAPVFVREWFGEIVRSNYRIFYAIAFGYVRNKPLAEDLVQNSVMKGIRGISGLKEPEAAVGWLAAITRNTCLEELRHKKYRFEKSLEEAGQVQASRSSDENLFELQHILLKAINALPDNQGLVVRLRFLEDCDVSEIAARLGLRKNTVEVRLHRALHALSKTTTLKSLRCKYQ